MPTYQYRCTNCGRELEVVQKFSDPSLTECPECAGALKKVFNAVGVVFKGSGFYRTDSRSGNSIDAKSSSSTGSGSGSSDSGSSGSTSSTGSSDSGSSSSPAASNGGSAKGSSNGSSASGTSSSSSTPAKAGASS